MFKFAILLIAVAALVFATPNTASAQWGGGYGQGFTPSPQPIYNGWGQVVGVARPDHGGYGGGSGISITIGTQYGGVTYWKNHQSPPRCPRCGRRHW